MTDEPKDPPIEWLNAVGRSIYKERDCPTQEYALDEARWLWTKPRFAKMEGNEAYESISESAKELKTLCVLIP